MKTTTNTQPNDAIVRIIEVVDTRTYEEQGDRWVPIAGLAEDKPKPLWTFASSMARAALLFTISISDF